MSGAALPPRIGRDGCAAAGTLPELRHDLSSGPMRCAPRTSSRTQGPGWGLCPTATRTRSTSHSQLNGTGTNGPLRPRLVGSLPVVAPRPRQQQPVSDADRVSQPEAVTIRAGGADHGDAGMLEPVAARTRDRLSTDRHWPGFVGVRGEGCARVRVSPPLIDQAIAVIDELLRRSRARGWRIGTVQHGSAVTPFEACVIVHEVNGVVSVIERARQVPHQPTAEDRRQLEAGEISSVHRFDRIPTGDLVVGIGPGQAVELVLPAGQAQATAAGAVSVGDRLEDLLDAFERRAETVRPSLPRPIELAEGLTPPPARPSGPNPFAADLRAWREARDLRELADAVEAHARRVGNRSAAVQQWLTDARRRAEQIDPAAAIASRG